MKEIVGVPELLVQADLLIRENRFEEAAPLVSLALVKIDDPLGINPLQPLETQVRALMMWGEIVTHQQKWNQVEKTYRKLVNLGVLDSRTRLFCISRLAGALQASGKVEEAEKLLSTVLDFEPTNSEEWIDKGLTLGQLERYDEASQAFKKALETDPLSARAISALKYEVRRKHEDMYPFTCLNCGTEQNIPIQSISSIDLMFQLQFISNDTKLREEFGLVADYGANYECSKCNLLLVMSLSLCLHCFEGYYSIATIAREIDGKRFWTQMTFGCQKCHNSPIPIRNRNQNEIEMLRRVTEFLRN